MSQGLYINYSKVSQPPPSSTSTPLRVALLCLKKQTKTKNTHKIEKNIILKHARNRTKNQMHKSTRTNTKHKQLTQFTGNQSGKLIQPRPTQELRLRRKRNLITGNLNLHTPREKEQAIMRQTKNNTIMHLQPWSVIVINSVHIGWNIN